MASRNVFTLHSFWSYFSLVQEFPIVPKTWDEYCKIGFVYQNSFIEPPEGLLDCRDSSRGKGLKRDGAY